MVLSKIRNNTFHRIGDRYANYFDPDHFMGRCALDNFDISKPKKKLNKAEEHYSIEVALPAFDRDDIGVTLSHNTLYVMAFRDHAKNYKDMFLRYEFHTNRQQRQFPILPEVDQAAISCSFSDGILKLTLPLKKKAVPEMLNRRIKVL